TIFGEKTIEANATAISDWVKITAQEIKLLPKGVVLISSESCNTVQELVPAGDVTARYFVRGSDNEQNVVLL
ncbi:MAG: hypothetical protein IPG53_21440, partial [Ignavibacteriales bacterium]|nr:hypothetical protein [Ignavibacteriales bacterium]